jgi:hypothetical protein
MAVTRTRMSAVAQRLDPWLPPILLMVVIFGFSAQSNLNSGLGTIDLIGRKIVHMSEYALLCFLWWRALLVVAIAYAATDEYHQHFVSGRHGTPVDVGIDAVGAGIAAFLIHRRHSR